MNYLLNCPFTTADVKLQDGKQQQTRLISGNGEKILAISQASHQLYILIFVPSVQGLGI